VFFYRRHRTSKNTAQDLEWIALGRKHAERTGLNICCLGRDVAKCLERNLEFLHRIGGYFRDYRIIFVENGSVDATPATLEKHVLSSRGKFVVIGQEFIFEKTRDHDIDFQRMQKMQVLRNAFIQHLIDNPRMEFETTVVIDIDLNIQMEIDDFFHALGYLAASPNAEGIAPNMLDRWQTLRDTYAYMEDELYVYDERRHELRHRQIKWKRVCDKRQEPFRVLSAFGGLSLYKTKSLLLASYSGRVDSCEHYNLNQSLKLYFDPKFIVTALDC